MTACDRAGWPRCRIAGAAAENLYDRIEQAQLALTEPLLLEMRLLGA